MANEQNLKPFPKGRSKEEAARDGKKGGIASGKARRAAKTYREAAKVLLAEKMNAAAIKGVLGDFFGLLGLSEDSKESGALLLALSDYARAVRDGDEDSIARLLGAIDDGEAGPSFRRNVIEVLPEVVPPIPDDDSEGGTP